MRAVFFRMDQMIWERKEEEDGPSNWGNVLIGT